MNEENLRTGIENSTDNSLASFLKRIWKDSSDQMFYARMIFNEDGAPADYIFLDINPAFEKELGLSRDQVAGERLTDLFPQHDPGWIRICGEVVRSGQSLASVEHNSWLDVWYDFQVFALDRQNEFISISRNITDLKCAQKALGESERKYREFVERASVGFYEIDFLNQRFLSVSDSMCKFIGYTREEMLEMNPLDFLVNQSKSLFITRMQQWLSGQKPENKVDFLIKTKDGREMWANLNVSFTSDEFGSPLGATVITQDITERKQAEEALRDAEQQLRLATQAAGMYTWELDVSTGGIRFSGDVRGVIGFSYTEYDDVFSYIGLYTASEDGDRHQEALLRTIRGEGDLHSVDRVINPDTGEIVWLETHATLVRTDDGTPQRVVGIAHNITEQVRAEEALRGSEKKAKSLVVELEKADNNKNQFISILSHELRNPLASIMMSLDLLNKVSTEGKHAAMALEIAKRQGQQLTRLVDDLLDVTRITQNKVALKKEWVELNEIIKKATLDYQSQFAEKMVRLEVKLTTSLYLEADPYRLTQVIGNLLHNAAKFISNSDLVSIIISQDANANEAVITIQDTGQGIIPKYLGNLFEPFTQADKSLDRRHGGLGLGLPIVKGMVELHGGRIEAFSEGRDKGTTFTIRLPLPGGDIEEPERDERLDPGSNGSLRILLIDDNKDLARVIGEIIDFIGHKTTTAYNGTEGIAKAGELRPDVVICDIGLPGMSGYEVAQRIRKDPELRDIFLIALSGYAQPEDVERSKEAGFDRHIGKPVSIETLQQVLNELNWDIQTL